jgi:hypothetical protein
LPTISNEQGFTFKTAIESKTSNGDKGFKLGDNKLSSMSLFLSDFATKLSKTKTVENCKLFF